jgi:hypothetical protein
MMPQTIRQPLDSARQAAYRHLALIILGVDIRTLTAGLRTRRQEAAPQLWLVPLPPRAA